MKMPRISLSRLTLSDTCFSLNDNSSPALLIPPPREGIKDALASGDSCFERAPYPHRALLPGILFSITKHKLKSPWCPVSLAGAGLIRLIFLTPSLFLVTFSRTALMAVYLDQEVVPAGQEQSAAGRKN